MTQVAATGKASADARPAKISRRRWLKVLTGLVALPVVGGAYVSSVEPFWPDYHDVPIVLKGLPPSFNGFRIAHLTDLHASSTVPESYLRKVFKSVADARPDLVVLTGDLVTHTFEYVPLVADLVRSLGVPSIASMGNHDHGVDAPNGVPTRLADTIERELTAAGCKVLRNASTTIDHADGRLWLVGLEDLWCGRFAPPIAFSGVSKDEPVIALSHNPDTAMEVDSYGPRLILSGHTHGGQVRLPVIGALVLPIHNRRFDQGHFQLPHGQLYISRGVGFLLRARFLCRPEVPTYVLSAG